MQVNRRRPGELYSDNINAIMDTIQVEEPKAAPAAAAEDSTPAAGSEGNAYLSSTFRYLRHGLSVKGKWGGRWEKGCNSV